MREISEQFIAALAANASALNNARKISQKGGFVKLFCSGDDTFYMGECAGSGKSNYISSADFIQEESPVFRCSCPSRQFPCKHSLALLFEINSGKEFGLCEIPEDIIKKRQKKEARAAKVADGSQESKPKVNKTARTKKIKKQLEGLQMTEEMISRLLWTGLGTMGSSSVKTYKDLAKQLGDYYLAGPQLYVNRLVIEIEAFQKDGNNCHYKEAANILVQLRALVKKADAYLKDKLDKDNTEDDDNILYEELGGVWKLGQLQALGLKKDNACLLQLSFQVIYDEARREFIDTGWWADVETGEVSVKRNYRPIKAMKYIKQDDTVFEAVSVPVLSYYPGEINRRIRWEGASYSPVSKEQLANLASHAQTSLLAAVKLVKNQIKNTLPDNFVVMLFAFKQIGMVGKSYVMCDKEDSSVLLEDIPGMEETTVRIQALPDTSLLENQVLLGAFFYNEEKRRICVQPYSIITNKQVVRLLY
ncbi:MAG: SWIM zinc finger family protein [Lachnospiraceae bacterium]